MTISIKFCKKKLFIFNYRWLNWRLSAIHSPKAFEKMTPMMSKYIFIRKFCMVWNSWIAMGKRHDFFVCFFLSSCRSCFSTSFLIITHRKRLNWTENKQISFRIAFITFNKHRADFSISQTFELCVCACGFCLCCYV